MTRFARLYAAARHGGAGLVDGHHPARLRHGQRARHRAPRAGARQRRSAGRGAHAHPRPLRRPGWRRDGRLRDRVPGWRAHQRRVGGRAGGAVRLPAAADRAGAPRRRWWRLPARARSTSCGRRAATSWTRCPIRGRWRRRSVALPLRVHVDIVTSSQMLVDPARTVLLLPAQTRYEQPGGCTETTTERRIVVQPRHPWPDRGRGEGRVADLPGAGGGGRPGGCRVPSAAATPRRSATRSPGSCRSTTASSTWPGRVTSSSGAASACAMAGSSRPPTARRTSGSWHRGSPSCRLADSC